MLGGVRLETILQTIKKTDALYQEKVGFQLLDLIITELKSHMTCYNSMPLIG